jgi:Uncharacterized protein conserved in bacteria
MQGTLLVTPEEMRSTADNLEGVQGQITSITQQMLEEARNLASIWEGDAATAYINKFNTLEDDMEKMRNMVREHVSDLRQMAGLYENAERANESEANSLPSDAIS